MLVSKKKYDELERLYHQSLNELEASRRETSKLSSKHGDAGRKIAELKAEIERLNELTIVDDSTGGSITLKVSKDLESVQPVVKYNPEVFEKLVELQYLDDTHQNNAFAIQLALMQITFEALSQIIESFEANTSE